MHPHCFLIMTTKCVTYSHVQTTENGAMWDEEVPAITLLNRVAAHLLIRVKSEFEMTKR